MKSNKLLMGILAGFAGGVLAGMLFAPEKAKSLGAKAKAVVSKSKTKKKK